MKTKFTIVLLLLLVSFEIIGQNYVIDAGHSTVQMRIERFGVVDVVGRFKAVEGTIAYTGDALQTNANAVIKVDSYDANNKGGEAAVKSAAFLDATNFPEITFKGKSVVTKDAANYLVGDLTIHGVTNQIELPFTINGPMLDLPTKKQSIAFQASITINRQDYGVSFDRKLPTGTKLVADDVKITLIILALAE